MKRKRLLLFLGCLAAVLLAGYTTLRLTAPRHRITKENFESIQIGMTEKEVEAILGVPAGDYSSNTSKLRVFSIEHFRLVLCEEGELKEWAGEDCFLSIRLKAAKVRIKAFGEFQVESFLTKLRRWLGMQ